MRKAPNEITVLTRGRGGSSSGILQSAEAAGDPSTRAEETDLSLDARNTVIASDLTGGGEQRHGWSTVARQRRSTLKSKQAKSRGGPVDGGSDRSDSAGVSEQWQQRLTAVGGAF